jgi:hypothetical protein
MMELEPLTALGIMFFKNEQMKAAIVAFQYTLSLIAKVCELQGDVDQNLRKRNAELPGCEVARGEIGGALRVWGEPRDNDRTQRLKALHASR